MRRRHGSVMRRWHGIPGIVGVGWCMVGTGMNVDGIGVGRFGRRMLGGGIVGGFERGGGGGCGFCRSGWLVTGILNLRDIHGLDIFLGNSPGSDLTRLVRRLGRFRRRIRDALLFAGRFGGCLHGWFGHTG